VKMIHFEELWEKSEQFYQSNYSDDNSVEILNSISMKINLLQILLQKDNLSKDDMEKAKSQLFGEILLSLTALSSKENIDVFNALQQSLQSHCIDCFSEKY
jgi:hypothetical protein